MGWMDFLKFFRRGAMKAYKYSGAGSFDRCNLTCAEQRNLQLQ